MGKLYIVPTPIGNLKDITLRAIEVLQNVDIVAAEDTRQTLKLLNHLEIKKTLISYHKHNEQGKSEDIISLLKEGKDVAIVSDAGTPGISDPGSVIIKKCIEEGINLEVLPGATAVTTALVYSGLDTTKFIFRGFIPRENKEKRKLVEELKDRQETIIFYESPYRIKETLNFIKDNFGERKISICRELTKLYEEIIRVSIEEAIEYYKENEPKGEYVLVLQGKTEEELKEESKKLWSELTVEEHIKMYIQEGFSKKEAMKMVAKEREMSKSDVYKYSFNL